MALTTGWEPDTPVEDTLLRRFVFAQAAAFEPVVAAMGGAAWRTDAYAVADLGRPAGLGNAVTLLRPLPPDPEDVLDGIEAAVGSGTGAVYLLSAWPTPDLHPRGWQLAGHPPMHLRPAAPLPDALPVPGLRIERVRAAAALRDAERVIVDGYPFADLQPYRTGALFD
ncbi:MAG: hypothetical protein AB7V44_17355, partial [Pseudonocardia sp.]